MNPFTQERLDYLLKHDVVDDETLARLRVFIAAYEDNTHLDGPLFLFLHDGTFMAEWQMDRWENDAEITSTGITLHGMHMDTNDVHWDVITDDDDVPSSLAHFSMLCVPAPPKLRSMP